MDAQAIAEPNTILRGLVGSTVHGLALEGTDDRDEMGVCIEPKEYVIGLSKFEQWTYRTQPDGVRSGPGDLDLVVYSLRKYCRLALHGNPTILLLLFTPEESLSVRTSFGEELRSHAPFFASRQAGKRFLGYLRAQRERLVGARGQKDVNRPELVVQHGYDTKYAMHMIRLGFQGIEFLSTGRLTLPMQGRDQEISMGIRQGQYPLEYVLDLCKQQEAELEELIEKHSPLPEKPNFKAVEAWIVSAYERYWSNKT